jgi:glycosyltransferase involved in cell wall biosynthesis
MTLGVPGLPAIVEALAEGRYDLVHLCSPGPAGLGAWLLAREGRRPAGRAFLAAHTRDRRLHLVLAGGGPEAEALRERLGDTATFLGWRGGEELARAYASADAFLFASQTDTFGQVILEAQASGLPVVAVDAGGPASLIVSGETGLLSAPEPGALAAALLAVTGTPLLARRLRQGGLAAVAQRTWPASLRQLADGYRRALQRTSRRGRRVA